MRLWWSGKVMEALCQSKEWQAGQTWVKEVPVLAPSGSEAGQHMHV